MEDLQALVILRSLANGVDPESGQLLDPANTFRQPQTLRALATAVRALERVERRERMRAVAPSKAMALWTTEEDHQLLAAFDAGMSPRELAMVHQRSPGAVRTRLAKLGRLARTR